MGNICSWCLKNEDETHLNGSLNDTSDINNSQPTSVLSSKANERTQLVTNSGNHNYSSLTSVPVDCQSNGEIIPVTPPPQPIVIDASKAKPKTAETPQDQMTIIVDRMLLNLIDVTGGGSNLPLANSNSERSNIENDSLKQSLMKSLSSTKILGLPDASINNIPVLLSGRPVSSDVCHYVAHTAGELSSLLINEIKIIHKEQLVVVFE